jgi:UDP-2,3-diacylglucosamine pyrophosphatase LpxH
MKNRITLFAVLLMSVQLLPGQQPVLIDNENLIVTHGPYLQNLSGSGVTIIWTTNRPAVPGVYLTGGKLSNTFIRNSTDGIINGGGTTHKVRIDGLEPGTKYEYRINSVQIMKYQAYKVYYGDTLTTKAVSFATFPTSGTRVKFTVVNDVHENSGKLASYLKNGKAYEQDFYIFNGDMIDFLQDYSQLFRGFADTAVRYFASTKPFFYVRGNHETRGYLARDIKDYFDYPGNRFYYGFSFGDVHFTVLDCGEDKPDDSRYYYGLADYARYRNEELDWLKKEVKSEDFVRAAYNIVFVHMPVLKQEKQNAAMQFLSEKFGPLLKEAGVDLVMSAHTHRNTFYNRDQTGWGFPLLVNSNNSYAEVTVEKYGIKVVVSDVSGKQVAEYQVK